MSVKKPYILYSKSDRYCDVIVNKNKMVLYMFMGGAWIQTGQLKYRMMMEDSYSNIALLSEEDLFLELL